MAWSQKFRKSEISLDTGPPNTMHIFQAPRFQLWTTVQSHWLLAVSCWLDCRGGNKLQAALQRFKNGVILLLLL